MKYILVSEKEEAVAAFRKMGVEAVLASTDEIALESVSNAISCRKTGTLIVSEHVREISGSILRDHEACGRLPFVMTLPE